MLSNNNPKEFILFPLARYNSSSILQCTSEVMLRGQTDAPMFIGEAGWNGDIFDEAELGAPAKAASPIGRTESMIKRAIHDTTPFDFEEDKRCRQISPLSLRAQVDREALATAVLGDYTVSPFLHSTLPQGRKWPDLLHVCAKFGAPIVWSIEYSLSQHNSPNIDNLAGKWRTTSWRRQTGRWACTRSIKMLSNLWGGAVSRGREDRGIGNHKCEETSSLMRSERFGGLRACIAPKCTSLLSILVEYQGVIQLVSHHSSYSTTILLACKLRRDT